jgi:formylmethanofuran dehydrogenase subunit B
MAEAYVNGQAVPRGQAIAAAARLLASATLPVIAGLAADAAGIRAALQLARTIGAVVDHAHGPVLSREAEVLARMGTMATTAQEIRRIGDVLLLAGLGDDAEAVRLLDYLSHGTPKRIVSLGPAPKAKVAVALPAEGEPAIAAGLALLRATCGERLAKPPADYRAAADLLRGAKFGAAVYSPALLGAPALEMVLGLAGDLNAGHRFSTVALPAPANGEAAMQICGWLFGVPLRSRWMDGGAKHDPWRFDARRLVETREADAALWIGPIEDPPDWLRRVPAVVLAGRGFAPDKMPEVAISVGRPGVDHPGVLYQLETRALCLVPPSRPTALPSSAEIVAAIHAALPASEGGA